MKRFLATLAVAGVLMALPARAQDKVTEAWTRLAHTQAILEHFYLEAGFYPPTLEDLDQVINSRIPHGAKKLVLPVDPATGAPFHYQPDSTGKHYVLAVPDASKYGGVKPLLSNMEWGYLDELANLRRYEQVIRQGGDLMQAIATRVEMYAKDNGGHFPATFDEMMPKYLNRFPTDTLTGKNLTYKQSIDGYVIANPNPERYGLKTFQYSSTKGLQIEQLAGKPATEGKAAAEIRGVMPKKTTP